MLVRIHGKSRNHSITKKQGSQVLHFENNKWTSLHSGPLCGVSEAVTHAYAEEYPVGILEVLILDLTIEHHVVANEVVDTATHVEAELHVAIAVNLDVIATHLGIDVINFPDGSTETSQGIKADLVAHFKQVVLLGIEVKACHAVFLEIVVD